MKPCPFCGSTKIKYSLKTGTQYFKRIYHACWYCWDCNTYGPRVLYKPAEDVRCRETVERDEALKADALKLWETRK
jgi:C4-type Zn-finger protein